MPHPRRAVRTLAITAVIAFPAVASTASAVTIGETFDGTTACDGITVTKTVPVGNTSYVVPSDGVLTSGSTKAESVAKRMAAVVYRQVGGNYELVGISGTQVPTGSGVKTYSTNIPVRQGDFLAQWVERRTGTGDVQKTCSGSSGAGFTTTWWYDSTPNVLPPTSVVSIASIGPTLNGSTSDSGWRYNISAELSAPAPEPTPDPEVPSSPSTSSGSTTQSTSGSTTTAPQSVALLTGRWTRPSARGVVRTWGAVPAGATRLTQSARPVRGGRAAARKYVFGIATTAPRAGTCAISGGSYLCTVRLSAGRWTITTSAEGPTGVVARSSRRVVVRPPLGALSVAG